MSNIDVVPIDISVAGRVLALFPEHGVPDNLSYLGKQVREDPACNIIKLPNISAPLNQLEACIAELQEKGYDIPNYPKEPSTPEEEEIQKKYNSVMGSAVNPVLREGNSDRRVAPPVKEYAQTNPHRLGIWSKASRTHVAHLEQGDFYGSEQSYTTPEATSVSIEFVDKASGETKTLKSSIPLTKGEVIDSSFMSLSALEQLYERELQDCMDNDLLFSLHLKATMMKISDPIFFGLCVKVFFKDAFLKHKAVLSKIGANPNQGLQSVIDTINEKCDASVAQEILSDIEQCYEKRPWLAMVDSSKGITNLHAPNDIIIDASMPVVVRDSGKMWNKLDELEDVKCVIPDRSYAKMYQEVITYVKTNGQFDVSTMGNVSNVGLMARKAEEYGSHDKTFQMEGSGKVLVKDDATGEVLMEHKVQEGDVWRMCQTQDEPIQDWVRLAVERGRATGARVIFWLDPQRAHDASLIAKVEKYLKNHDTAGLDISILRPTDACRISMERSTLGLDSISVTGNVLRDYLTDLFPILELGTSAKMLSVVPLLKGGGLYETGAGGSAPKHVQQFVKEGHLRWDSLGEYLALAVALESLTDNPKAKVLGDCLNKAVGRILKNRKSPSRVVNQIDNRATNFYIALYWADFLAQEDDTYLPLATELQNYRSKIVEEFSNSQGEPVDLGGYFLFDSEKATKAMNPSSTLNKILASVGV